LHQRIVEGGEVAALIVAPDAGRVLAQAVVIVEPHPAMERDTASQPQAAEAAAALRRRDAEDGAARDRQAAMETIDGLRAAGAGGKRVR
jgi:hypothetical protein